MALEAEQPEDRHEVPDVQRRARTDRSRCSRRSGGRSPAGPASPGVVACRMPRHSSSSSRPLAAGPAAGRVTGSDPEPSRAGRPHKNVRSRSLCYRASQMQTTLARRQRHRRALAAPPRGSGGTCVRRILIAIPIILILLAVLTAAAGALFTVAAYNYYATGLPDPKAALTNLDFEQQTIVYDRTGKVELARLGSLRREVVTFDQIPAEMLDATTADRGQGLLGQPGLRPGRHRAAPASTPSPAGRAAPRRSPSSSSAPDCSRRGVRAADLRAQDQGDHPVDPPDRGVSGRGRQAADHHRVPQPELLRQQQLRREGRGQGLLRQAARRPDLAQYAILAAIPQSPTKFDLIKNAEEVCLDTPVPERPTPRGDDPPECEKVELVVPRTARSSSAATTSSI